MDSSAQLEELDSLKSIFYNEEFQVLESSDDTNKTKAIFWAFSTLPENYTVKYVENLDSPEPLQMKVKHLPPIELRLTLPEDYPSTNPPEFVICCQWLPKSKISLLCKKLDNIWLECGPAEIIYVWCDFLKSDSLSFLSSENELDLTELCSKHLSFLQKLQRGEEKKKQWKEKRSSRSKDSKARAEGNVVKPLENAAKPLENAEKPLENAAKPLENAAKPLENAEKPLENAEKPLENAAKPLQNAEKPLENAAKSLENATKPLENAAKPLKNAAKSLENAAKPLENAAKSLENAAKPLQNAEKPLENAAKSLENATKPLENAAKPLKNAAKSLENAAKPLENAAKPLKNAAKPLENATKPLENATKPLQNAEKPLENAAKPLENAAKPLENAAKPLKNAAKSLENATKPLENATKPLQNAEKPLENAAKPLENAAKPLENATKPLENAAKPLENAAKSLENGDANPSPSVKANNYRVFKNNKRRHPYYRANHKNKNSGPRKWVNRFDERAVLNLSLKTSPIKVVKNYNIERERIEFLRNFYTCTICFTDKLGKYCTQFKDCNHVFCIECIRSYFTLKIKDGNVQSIKCPEEKCTSEALPSQVKEIVSEELFAKYDSVLLTTALDTLSDIIYCPRQICQYPVSWNPEEKMASCPNCQFAFCVNCKMVYHGVEPCQLKIGEVQRVIKEYENGSEEVRQKMELRYGKKYLETLVNNMKAETWIKENSKECPRCEAAIEKAHGCNKMVCWNCNAPFCWLCCEILDPKNPYSHFNDPKSRCVDKLFYLTHNLEEEGGNVEEEEEWDWVDDSEDELYDSDFDVEGDHNMENENVHF